MKKYVYVVRGKEVKFMFPKSGVTKDPNGFLWYLGRPILGISDPSEKERIIKLIREDKIDQIPNEYFTRFGKNPNGLWVGTDEEWKRHPVKIEMDRREKERVMEYIKRTTIYLSTRGWGDLPPVEWVGDITRPDEEILYECKGLLKSASDVDDPCQTDAEILEKIKKARDRYEEKVARVKEDEEIDALGVTVKVLSSGKIPSGEEGCFDYYAVVEVTDNETEKTLKFECRNILDAGYVIRLVEKETPGGKYPMGIGVRKNKRYLWRYYDYDKKEYVTQEMTDFESRAYRYLCKRPPIYSGVNM